ncbi:chitin synthase III catalytic subunit-domain-containing protein [Suillus cothurnatus]|nr:chitin synthase III catalytic subunit-domain-containing protein [Suillus cothurnatus]
MTITFGSFDGVCSTAALVICPLLGTSGQGVEPTCYSRNVQIGQTLIFQPATSFVHIVAIIMTAIMIYHIRSKYSAWFAAVDTGLVAAAYCCCFWLLRISCVRRLWRIILHRYCHLQIFASFSPSKPIALFVVYLIWPILCVTTYTHCNSFLYSELLTTAGPRSSVAFSVTICYAITHYLDGLFFFTLCREDLEFSVGSKATVWEVKDPLLTASVTAPSTDYEEDASSYHAGAASLVGGVSGGQYYGGKQAYGAQGGYGQGAYGGARRAYPPTSEGY